MTSIARGAAGERPYVEDAAFGRGLGDETQSGSARGRDNFSEPDLARLGRQSVSTFSRLFRKHTGMTFVQYVNSLRIELARQRLGPAGLTTTETCYAAGFNNMSNFNRQFLAAKGRLPPRFRFPGRDGRRFALAA